MKLQRHSAAAVRTARRERGIALVSALWVSALVVILATELTAYVQTENRMARAELRATQARYAAEGALHIAFHDLLYRRGGPWPADGTSRQLRVAELTAEVEVWDEAGRVDLNLAPPELVRALVAVCAAEDADVDALTDAILDWRDADSVPRLHGAEDAQYAAMGLIEGAGDQPFESAAELAAVLGMDEATYAALEQAVSVHSRHAGVNPAFAPRTVLLALADGAAEEVDAFLEARREQSGSGLSGLRPSFVDQQFATTARGESYRLTARAQAQGGALLNIQAVVTFARGNLQDPVQVLEWREYASPAIDAQSSGEEEQ